MTKNILLINPPIGLDRQIVQPLGIASIAGQLRQAGYKNIRVIDGCYLTNKHGYDAAFKIISDEIQKIKPFIVGCTFHSSLLGETERICDLAFQSGAHVILGGHGATACHEKSAADFYHRARKYNQTSITAIVRGEGEATAVELVNALFAGRRLTGIPGVTFFNGTETIVNPGRELLDINILAAPAMDLLPPPSEYGGWYNIEESRGCVFRCAFCSISIMYPVVRLKSPERIRIEVEKARELGAEQVYLTGELTLLKHDRAFQIGDVMQSCGMRWSTGAHPSLIRKARKVLPVLKDSGLTCIEVGIEGGTKRSLDIFNKGTTPEMNRQAMSILESAGVQEWLHFIPFHPYMNMRDLSANIMFMNRNFENFVGRDNYPDYLSHAWVPTEGTPLFDRATKDGLLTGRDGKEFLQYQDRRVIEAKQSYDTHFLQKYGPEYYRLHSELLQMLDTTHPDELGENPRFMLIGTLPLSALYLAYVCALTGVPAQPQIEELADRFLTALRNADYSVAAAEMLDEALSNIEA